LELLREVLWRKPTGNPVYRLTFEGLEGERGGKFDILFNLIPRVVKSYQVKDKHAGALLKGEALLGIT
jgi:hypothetical protein